MPKNMFFNAHHSPIGAFSSFTLGFPGAKGGLGLGLGKPAGQNVFIGAPPAMRPGYMCERVNFSDWEGRDNIGGSLFGSCWPEVSLLLTAVELPGIYAQPDSGLLCVLDHVEARLVVADDATVTLECRNPTPFDATVRVCAESSAAARTILGQAAALRWPALDIPAGATRVLTLGPIS